MKLKRYFVPDSFELNKTIVIEGDEFHHLKNVMRARVGEEIELFNGTINSCVAKVCQLNKNNATVSVEQIIQSQNEPQIKVTLFQAVCKGEKLSLITQKITELGATDLVVFYSQFTDIKDKTTKLDKLDKVCISACKQCRRNTLLNISNLLSFDQMVEKAKNLQKTFVAYENAEGKTLLNQIINSNLTDIGIIIGAEGGFSENEIQILEQNGIEIVSLGKRILRTETASIASIATIMFACE